MKCHLQCAEQQVSLCNLTKYCACHGKWFSWLILVTYETPVTMRGATGVFVQPHQMLRVPRKMFLMTDPCHIWNVFYNARSNRCLCPTSPNTAPATKNDSHEWLMLFTYETSFTMRGATGVIVQPHQILCLPRKMILILILVTYEISINRSFTMRGATGVIVQPHQIPCLPRKMTVQNMREIWWNVIYNARPIRDRSAWSDHDPSMKPSVRNPRRNRGYFSRASRACCMEKHNISRSGYHSEFHRILRLPRKVTLQLHQMLRLPRKMTLMINPFHTWNAFYNARSNSHWPTSPNIAPATKSECHHNARSKCHCPNSPNIAPATKSHPHHWSLSIWNAIYIARSNSCHWPTSEILRLPRKVTLIIDPCHILVCETLFTMRGATADWPTSPNTAPATKNDNPKYERNLMKTDETSFTMRDRFETVRHDPTMIRAWNRQSATRGATEVTFRALHEHVVWKNTTFRAPAIIPNFTEYCACHEKWHFNFTKFCACHEKWLSWSILFTHETLFTMRGATAIDQPHQILRLPRKVSVTIMRGASVIVPTPQIPATKSHPHHWSLSHMKRYIYIARSNSCH